jgi:hypothetical protein
MRQAGSARGGYRESSLRFAVAPGGLATEARTGCKTGGKVHSDALFEGEVWSCLESFIAGTGMAQPGNMLARHRFGDVRTRRARPNSP